MSAHLGPPSQSGSRPALRYVALGVIVLLVITTTAIVASSPPSPGPFTGCLSAKPVKGIIYNVAALGDRRRARHASRATRSSPSAMLRAPRVTPVSPDRLVHRARTAPTAPTARMVPRVPQELPARTEAEPERTERTASMVPPARAVPLVRTGRASQPSPRSDRRPLLERWLRDRPAHALPGAAARAGQRRQAARRSTSRSSPTWASCAMEPRVPRARTGRILTQVPLAPSDSRCAGAGGYEILAANPGPQQDPSQGVVCNGAKGDPGQDGAPGGLSGACAIPFGWGKLPSTARSSSRRMEAFDALLPDFRSVRKASMSPARRSTSLSLVPSPGAVALG